MPMTRTDSGWDPDLGRLGRDSDHDVTVQGRVAVSRLEVHHDSDRHAGQ